MVFQEEEQKEIEKEECGQKKGGKWGKKEKKREDRRKRKDEKEKRGRLGENLEVANHNTENNLGVRLPYGLVLYIYFSNLTDGIHSVQKINFSWILKFCFCSGNQYSFG